MVVCQLSVFRLSVNLRVLCTRYTLTCLYYEVIFKYCAVSNRHYLPREYLTLLPSFPLVHTAFVRIVGIRSTSLSYIWCEHNEQIVYLFGEIHLFGFSQRYFRTQFLCARAPLFLYVSKWCTRLFYIYISIHKRLIHSSQIHLRTREMENSSQTKTHTRKIKISRKRFENLFVSGLL